MSNSFATEPISTFEPKAVSVAPFPKPDIKLIEPPFDPSPLEIEVVPLKLSGDVDTSPGEITIDPEAPFSVAPVATVIDPEEPL